ncbi:MAG TPA: ankyrin repeat domain-containing protein [Blastocatellia bacterium]|nr:ankyrin repeat domain-containing protein [Blastocatellia bacterium]
MTFEHEFLRAVTEGDAARVKELLEQDPSLAVARGEDGVSAVLKAVYHQKPRVVEVLLATGIELNIFEASATGRTARVREMLDEDASLVNAFAPDGFYPLGLAAFFGHRETFEVILSAGGDVNLSAKNAMKVTALHAAAASGHTEMVRQLLERGADPNVRQQAGFAPLHEAAASGLMEMAELLLAHGADVNARTDDGKTPLAFALDRNRAEAAELLREHGGVN